MTRAKRDRLVLAITFGLTNVALLLFAILPLDTVMWAEVLIGLMAALAAAGVVMNVSDRGHQAPLVRYSYLMTGATALFTLAAFLVTYGNEFQSAIVIPLSLFILADVAGGFAAHIAMEDRNG